jgi:hypothetical protein
MMNAVTAILLYPSDFAVISSRNRQITGMLTSRGDINVIGLSG